jgi:hypothetical protein
MRLDGVWLARWPPAAASSIGSVAGKTWSR